MITVRFPDVAEDVLFDVETINDLRSAIKEASQRMPYYRCFKIEVMCPDEHPKESVAVESIIEPHRAISDVYLQGQMKNIERVNNRINVYLQMAKEGENVSVTQCDNEKNDEDNSNVISLF